MSSPTSLAINGYRDQPVPNTFTRQQEETRHLSIILPGYNYSAQMPGLYYPILLMLERGADIFSIDYSYSNDTAFASAPAEERSRWMAADITAACNAVLSQREYEEITLVGKSLGTRAMAHLLDSNERFRSARCIWLTPLLRNEALRAAIGKYKPRSLFVIGTVDEQYDEELLAEVVHVTGGTSLVIEGANHGLNVPGDVMASIRAIERLVEAVASFP